MVHRQRYSVFTSRHSVLDLLALDEANPRSVRFQLEVVGKIAGDLTKLRGAGQPDVFAAQVAHLQAKMASHTVSSLDKAALRAAHRDILNLSTALHATYMQ
jgi:uncharacterized alpha-E superfamily protein